MSIKKSAILELLLEIREREELVVSELLVENCYKVLETNQFNSDVETYKELRDLIVEEAENEISKNTGG